MGPIINLGQVKVHHLRDKSKSHEGVVTVAYAEGPKHIGFGFAFCSPTDNFVREIGKNIATERLHNQPLIITTTTTKGKKHTDIGRVEAEKFILRLMLTRDWDRLHHRAARVPNNFHTLVPGWFKKWGKKLINQGLLCTKACNPQRS